MKYIRKIMACIATLIVICTVNGVAVSKYVLPKGLKEIRAEAFADLNADEIVLPDSIEYIAPDVFEGTKSLTAVISPGSYAHLWCMDKALPYKVVVAVGERLDPEFAYGDVSFSAVESTDPMVAIVDEAGIIAGISTGTTIIKMASDGCDEIELPLEVVHYAETHRALCVAHRGASGYYRENTIKAFEHAYELGADIVELDVHKTKDGVIVVFHDKKIKSGDTKKPVASLSYKALRKLDSRICTLQEAIECIEKTDMTVMVEFKATGITEDVIEIVEAGGMGSRVLYSGFDLNTLLEVEQLRPETDTAYSINSKALAEAVIASPELYNVDIAGINHKYLTTELIRDMHLAGKEVYAWTVNTKSRINACVAMGVDGVLTNYPDYM